MLQKCHRDYKCDTRIVNWHSTNIEALKKANPEIVISKSGFCYQWKRGSTNIVNTIESPDS